MGRLEEYRRKRRFDKTPEPPPKKARAAGNRFVVQKHAARRLHYDLRLEIEGTLVSWAVPKGPPLNPADKRLAMQTEDHPLEYAGFEGNIPEGQYGAGTVMVWDTGSYEVEGELPAAKQLARGELKFILHGQKLRGGFVLVKLRRGEKGFVVEPDRRAAIALAVSSAGEGDAVLVAGKGHEPYQLVGKERLPFSDRDEARRALGIPLR